jgi:hypothetical protein
LNTRMTSLTTIGANIAISLGQTLFRIGYLPARRRKHGSSA